MVVERNHYGFLKYFPAGYAAVSGWIQQKYPNIEVKYQSYSDYENEVSRQIADGDYPDVLFVPGSVSADKFSCLLAICIIFAIVVLARFGGDEFVLCVDRKDVELVQPKLEELVTRMCRTFSY